jgi:hypothetical protein
MSSTADLSPALSAATGRSFDDLLRFHGYEPLRFDEDPPTVLYGSPKAFFAVVLEPDRDPGTRTANLRIGPLRDALELGEGFDVGDLVLHAEPQLSRVELTSRAGEHRFRCTTPEEVATAVERLAGIARRVPAVLAGGDDGFAQLAAARRARYDAWIGGMRIEDLRSDAAAAWDAGDWAHAAELYATIPEGQATAGERKRLEIAHRRADG